MDDHEDEESVEEPVADGLSERKRQARRDESEDDDPAPVAVSRREPERQHRALDLARVCARIADDNRGREITLLDLREASPLFDFFVLVTAPSRRQAATILSDIDAEMKRRQERKIGSEGAEEGRWALVDYGDFVVHVFSDDARSFYALEDIWGDAPQLEWRDPSRPSPAGSSSIQLHEPDSEEPE